MDLHVTCNTMPRNDEMARLPQWLELLEEAGVTAVILADVGVLALAKPLRPLRQDPHQHPGQHRQLPDGHGLA